ncbi:MAG: TolC family protein [Candidatus Solibacter sp.]|nr:TolC family protein [Candidatus Solibacter sp.]
MNKRPTDGLSGAAVLARARGRSPKGARCLPLRRAHTIRTLWRGGLLAVCGLGTAWMAGAQDRLSLDQAVAEALQNNVGLLAEKANIAIAEAKILSARLRPNPVVSASGDHLDVLGTGFSETNGGGPAEYTVRMDFPIEVGGKRARRTEVAQLARSVTELQFRNAVRGVALEVANAFVDAQVARESLHLAKENLTYFEGIVEVNLARLRAGEIAEVELLRSRLASLQQRNLARGAEARWRAGLIRLQTAMGRTSPSMTLELVGDLRRDAGLPERDQLRQAAFEQRPDLLALRQDLARAGADIRSQVSQAKVDPTVGTEYRRQQGINGMSNSTGVFLEVPLPVFSRNQGEIERARQEQRQAELRIRQLQILITGEVDAAHEEMLAADGLLRNIEGEMLEQARDVRRVTEYSYRRGHVTLLELLDAQRTYNETLQAHIDARAAYARSLYLLDSVAGRTVTK